MRAPRDMSENEPTKLTIYLHTVELCRMGNSSTAVCQGEQRGAEPSTVVSSSLVSSSRKRETRYVARWRRHGNIIAYPSRTRDHAPRRLSTLSPNLSQPIPTHPIPTQPNPVQPSPTQSNPTRSKLIHIPATNFPELTDRFFL